MVDSSFNLLQTGDDHLRKRQQERLLSWGESIFAEPRADANGINPRLYELGYISQEQETVLYRDLLSRDSEVGLGLLNWRRAELLDSLAYLRTSIKKREYTASLARSRRESLDRLSPEKPANEAQAAVEDELEAELAAELERLEAKLKIELIYLRSFGSKMDSLERVIKLVGSESAIRIPRASEQMLRLFSQSWRGMVKIKSWALRFGENAHLPSLQPHRQPGEPESFLLPLGGNRRAVSISRETAGYMLHMLEAIDALAVAWREHYLAEGLATDTGWGQAHKLVRAIVEFFYFCNFELPYSHLDLAVDPEDPAQLCVYDYQSAKWQVVTEDINSSRTLKRVGAEAAQLLIEGGALLKCRRDGDLSAIIEEAMPQLSVLGDAYGYRLFMCSGLAEFDLDPAGQRVKFHMAFNSMGKLIDSLVEGQTGFSLLNRSRLGGPLDTLLGMALLDWRAFSSQEGETGPDPIARFQVLSQFWRAIGRRRAVAMLGESYVKQVTSGLSSLGEQGPDHPTFFTIHASVMFASSIGSKSLSSGVEAATISALNPFSSLGLSDQIRLLDLVMQTWGIAEEMLEKLRDVHSQGKLRRVVEGLPAVLESRKENIELRFSPKWMKSGKWYWIFMRTCAPTAWEFWSKISNKEPWESELINLSPYQVLGTLLRLFGDLVRLLLVIELSDAEVTQSLPTGAESAGQTIVQGIEGFLEGGGRLSPQIAEAVNFYYDPEIRFDSWLAFTSSFRQNLVQMNNDLRALNADADLLNAVELLAGQLEILYPVRHLEPEPITEAPIQTAEPEPEVPAAELPVIGEKEAERINYLLSRLLGPSDRDMIFLKLISLSARPEKRSFVSMAVAYSDMISALLPVRAHRSLLFNLPGSANNFFYYLMKLSEQGPLTQESIIELQPQVGAYFEELGDLYGVLVSHAGQVPALLPQDKERLLSYLKESPQKSPGLGFLLMLVCDRFVLDISDLDELKQMQVERAESKVRAYLRGQLNAIIEEPSIEIYPLGGGRIVSRGEQLILSAGSENFEPLWSELNRPASQSIYGRYASAKFSAAAEILAQELGYQVLVR